MAQRVEHSMQRSQLKQQLAEGYRAMAEENQKAAEQHIAVFMEIVGSQ